MLEALDHQTLLEVAKRGFMSRGLHLADLIAVVQNNTAHQPPATPVNPAPPFCVLWALYGNACRQRKGMLQRNTTLPKHNKTITKHLCGF